MNIKTISNILRIAKTGYSKNSVTPFGEKVLIDNTHITYISQDMMIVRIKHEFSFDKKMKPFEIIHMPLFRRLLNFYEPYGIICNDASLQLQGASGRTSIFPVEIPGSLATAPDMYKDVLDPKLLGPVHYNDIIKLKTASSFRSGDELRPIMNIIYYGENHIVASDAHKLYFSEASQDFTCEFHYKAIEIMHFLKSGFNLYETVKSYKVISVCGDVEIQWRKADGNYPNWHSVVPKEGVSIIVSTIGMIKALEQVTFALPWASRLVKLEILEGQIKIIAKELDFGYSTQEIIPCINPDKLKLEIGFKYDFLLSIVKILSLEHDQISIKLIDASKAVILGERILLMPMMIT